jgi:esterase/lipase superfamily enzyme
MNTYSRESILELKNAIKVLANNQKVLKNQRKTVHIVGERTMPTWEATWKHASARTDLRHMYIAYGIILLLTQLQSLFRIMHPKQIA